ncbi:hypothetical protein BOH66_16265 [Microbacterium aurum]|uniref:PknH-like extracellular domain-containing protein n=2 Tax=Microbacterium aurum TaxID=36805 RepID=A0A1P8UBU7_9MICO|nr:hypothetical protein BOH66_16265 [Microbacterium aurum]
MVTASVVFGAAGCSALPGSAPKAANASAAMFTDSQVQQAFASLETMLSDPFIYNGNIASDLTPVPDFTATGVPEQCIPVAGAFTLAVAADARKDIRITGVSTGRYDGQVSVSYRTAARTFTSVEDATISQQALVDAAGDATCTTAAAAAMKQRSLTFDCQEAFCDIKASSGEGSAAQYAVVRRFAYGNLLVNVTASVYGDGSSLDQINPDDLSQMVAKIQSALDDTTH